MYIGSGSDKEETKENAKTDNKDVEVDDCE